MANEQNLIPQAHKLTVEEASKGGKKSGEARRRKRNLQELVNMAFERVVSHDKDGRAITADEAMVLKQLQNALDGDTKAFITLRDTAGQAPIQRVEVDTIDPQARAEMDELLGLN